MNDRNFSTDFHSSEFASAVNKQLLMYAQKWERPARDFAEYFASHRWIIPKILDNSHYDPDFFVKLYEQYIKELEDTVTNIHLPLLLIEIQNLLPANTVHIDDLEHLKKIVQPNIPVITISSDFVTNRFGKTALLGAAKGFVVGMIGGPVGMFMGVLYGGAIGGVAGSKMAQDNLAKWGKEKIINSIPTALQTMQAKFPEAVQFAIALRDRA